MRKSLKEAASATRKKLSLLTFFEKKSNVSATEKRDNSLCYRKKKVIL
jgi:hypothetical protein